MRDKTRAYIRRELDHLYLSKTPSRILYRLHDKLASCVNLVLVKSRLILSRINVPIVCMSIT